MTLCGEVECDEVYVVAGHKGNPAAVAAKGRTGRRNRLRGDRGRGTLEKEKPPVFGMIQRCGEVVIQMLANVQQKTIEPLIRCQRRNKMSTERRNKMSPDQRLFSPLD